LLFHHTPYCRQLTFQSVVPMFLRLLYLITLTVFVIDIDAFGQKNAAADSSVSNATSSIGFSSEPRILLGETVAFPSWIIKKGLEGTVTLSIDINQNGKVEKSSLTKPVYPVLDSIALASIANLVCTPAFEKGKAVLSTVVLRIDFIPDSMVASSRSITPDIEGVVLNATDKTPIPNAIVNIQFIDTTSDTDVTIGFCRYLALIGKLPGQHYTRGIMSTKTDRTGRFMFRLLPFCPARISVLADGYEIAHFFEYPKPDKKSIVRYSVIPTPIHTTRQDTVYHDSLNVIKVYGHVSATSKTINVERSEYDRGLSHSVSKLLLSQSTIRQMPEGASALLVRGGSPYDNRYLISGVPFLAPYHFGGYPYGDIDGMMISALTDIKVTVNDVAGRFADASGALIEAQPGIYRQTKVNYIPRPEIAVDFGRLGCDVMLSIPTGKYDKDILQIGCTVPDSYSLKWMYYFYGMKDSAALDIGQPINYANITINNSKRIGAFQYDVFGWFADDFYVGSHDGYPWGMGSVTIHPVDHDNITLTCGGSHQYFAKGKRIGNDTYLSKTFLSNATINFTNNNIPLQSAIADVSCRLDYQEWQGRLEYPLVEHPGWNATMLSEHGRETELQVHGGIEKKFGILRVRTQVLGTGVLYDKVPDGFVDAGISLLWNFGDFQTELNAGRVTSRPDIRGLPDSSFRMQQLHSYLVSLPLNYRNNSGLNVGIEPYLRYQDKCPQMSTYYYNVWNSSSASAQPLFAKGIDCNAEVQLVQNLSLNGIVNIEDAKRINADDNSLYEWNVPWSVRSGVHYSFVHKSLHLYLNYVISKGLPYCDFGTQHTNVPVYKAVPYYERTDLSIQFRTQTLHHRYLTRYDGYLTVCNLFNQWNVRDYYWDKSMTKRAIYLCPVCFDMGVRVGFRL
jgi:TonB family protein